MRRTTVALTLAGWTSFVWLTRVRNAIRDDAGLGAYLLSLSFLVLAVGVLATRGRDRRWGLGLALWTLVVWPVRLVDIVFGSDHGVGFIAVHAALGAASIALAVIAVRAPARDRSEQAVA